MNHRTYQLTLHLLFLALGFVGGVVWMAWPEAGAGHSYRPTYETPAPPPPQTPQERRNALPATSPCPKARTLPVGSPGPSGGDWKDCAPVPIAAPSTLALASTGLALLWRVR